MRSLLFVPADSERKLEKALSSGADVLILDLEDSVSPDRKEGARGMAAEFIPHAKARATIFVRVNDLGTGLTDADLEAVMRAAPHGIMLPKSNHLDDVARLSVKIRVREAENGIADGSTTIIPIITETPLGVLNAASYARGDPRLAGLTWGAEDLSAELGASATRLENGSYTDSFRLARATTVFAAAAADVAAIDTVFPSFGDEVAFRQDCLESARDGFTARMAIHPAQVPIINAVFTPSPEAVEQARQVVAAFADAGNPGVVAIDGKMYDRPHLKRAQRLLARVQTTSS